MNWLTAAVEGIGNLGASLFNYDAAKKANKANIQLSREQMAFQERMSNTAVQRHAKDLEAAGFNRLLAAGGNGASTPAGSSPTVRPAEITPIDIMAIEKARADISKTKAETVVSHETAANLKEQNRNLSVQNDLLRAQVKSLGVKTDLDTREYKNQVGIGISNKTHSLIRAVAEVVGNYMNRNRFD